MLKGELAVDEMVMEGVEARLGEVFFFLFFLSALEL